MAVGGSEDAECSRLSDQVQLIDKYGKVSNRKPISQPRAKMGLAVGELRSEANAQFRKTFIYAFGGVDIAGNPIRICEKYNVRANIWQSLPNLQVARHSASGTTMGDSLYVFGGVGGATFIEKLNLKLNMLRSPADRFEVIEPKLPQASSDIGLISSLSPTEILIAGGFSAENRSI